MSSILFLPLNLILTHLFIWWSCNDSSIISKLSLYFSLPNRSVMSSAQTYAYMHIHICYNNKFHFPTFQTLLSDWGATYLESASSDSSDTASWSPLSPMHCALPGVGQAVFRQATQPPAALEDKSPSRGRWWGGQLPPPAIWDRIIPVRDQLLFLFPVSVCRDSIQLLPLNEGTKEESDGFLDVLCAQPAPLVLHQQTQDVQGDVCQSGVCSKHSVSWKHIVPRPIENPGLKRLCCPQVVRLR